MRYRYVKVEGERQTEILESVELPGTQPPRLAFRVDVGNTPPEHIDAFLDVVRRTIREGGVEDFLMMPHRGGTCGTEVYELIPVED